MTLTTINVWLDIVFTGLYLFLLIALMFHFSLYVKTGRFRKSFIEGIWAEHDTRPPALPKALHFVHMTAMIILGASGMYLRFPYFYGGRTLMRDTHYVFMIIVIVVLVWRVLYAFLSKTNADWKEFAIGKKDLQTTLGVLAFYGYFSNDKPHVAKYNVLQKLSYNMFLYMMILQAITGLALLKWNVPLLNVTVSQAMIGWNIGALVGSSSFALWIVRTVHYVLNWAFILMTTIHLYLAGHVDAPVVLDFFGVQELQLVDHGHGHDEVPTAPAAPSNEAAPISA